MAARTPCQCKVARVAGTLAMPGPEAHRSGETGAVGRLGCVARGSRRGDPDGLSTQENTQTWASAERPGACDGACVQSPQPFRRYRLLAAAELHGKNTPQESLAATAARD